MSLFRTCDWWEAASSDPGSLQYDVASLVVDSLAGEEDQQVEHCTVLYCTVLYCTTLYCTVLYCTADVPAGGYRERRLGSGAGRGAAAAAG